ncbi:alpha/beta hydrolase [Massilia sp. MB5]|uniref:alpha/beta fold hydrolase n=1 Tax=Massilia sp. MB5 TaxID=2919578 RepID=UPI001F10C4F0|nr:alpha/beta hydrolase [Massilia sp. MB5]UMR31031.1 alpha/beta hydrolase [Massilia sp. MB5]
MDRRHFLTLAGGAVAATALGGTALPAPAAPAGKARPGRPHGVPAAVAGVAQAAAPGPALDAAAFHAARRFQPTRFGRIAYIEQGSGPAALFLHGFPLNSFQWRGALPLLAPYRRCVAPDFLGLGYTEVAPGQGMAPQDQVAMLAELLDRLRIDSVDLIANDSGGAVAQLFMVRYPQRVRSLLLTNCDSEPECPPAALAPVIELAKAGTFADQWFQPWLADKALARSAQGIGGMCYADPAHPSDEALECYLGPLVSSPQRKAQMHAYAVALERNSLQGIGAALKASRVPVRVLWGEADDIFTAASARYFEQAFGNGRGLRRLPGSKLFWPEERPELLAAEARALWGLA